MDKSREYEVILEALYGLRTATKSEIALAHWDGEKDKYDGLAERMWDIDNTIDNVREEFNKLLSNGG